MYPRRAKQKIIKINWDKIFEDLVMSGWNLKEISDVTGISHHSLRFFCKNRRDIPEQFNQAIALVDLYLLATHKTNLPTL